MDKIMFAILIGVMGFITYKNITLISRYKNNKSYIDAYQKVLRDDSDAYENICKYIETEKNLEFKNKANIIKLYCELHNNLEYENTSNSIDLKQLFFNKNEYSNSKTSLNSDSFVFIILTMSKAYEKNKPSVITNLINKLNTINKLGCRVEYQTAVAFGNALLNVEDKGVNFMKALHEGTYTEFAYDKNLIGIFKRIASATLAFDDVEMDEYFSNDLHSFAATTIGGYLLKNINIYNRYLPVQEEKIEQEQ